MNAAVVSFLNILACIHFPMRRTTLLSLCPSRVRASIFFSNTHLDSTVIVRKEAVHSNCPRTGHKLSMGKKPKKKKVVEDDNEDKVEGVESKGKMLQRHKLELRVRDNCPINLQG